MGLADSDYLIRDYDDIRELLRNTYIFGCYTKEDYASGLFGEKISTRKIEKEQARLRQFLPEDFFLERRENRKALKYCKYDLIDNAENQLAETYRNKSFTALDILSFLLVQEILFTEGEMQLQALLDAIPDEIDLFDKNNLRIKLNELVEKDLVYSRKEGRNIYYGIRDDIFSEFTNDELMLILTYVDFMKRTSAIEMPFYFLQRKICLYLKCERNIEVEESNIFRYKFNHIFNVLDNEIMLDILKAINKKLTLCLKMDHKKRYIRVKPLKIIHDVSSGRQFVYCYCIDAFHPYKLFRLDRLNEIEVVENSSDKDILFDDRILERCWCVSGIEEEPTEVIIEFHFDEEREPYILKRIQREGHGGILTHIEKNIFEYKICVGDPQEIIPWIRSFGEKAKVLSSGASCIENAIYDNWMEALKKYETI